MRAGESEQGRFADNKIALNAGWDLEILQLELSELASLDVDIDPTLTGFSTGEIDVILTSAGDPDDEVIPPVPATPRTKPGEVWILGDHRVGCGDSRDAEFLQRVIGHEARVDAAFLETRSPRTVKPRHPGRPWSDRSYGHPTPIRLKSQQLDRGRNCGLVRHRVEVCDAVSLADCAGTATILRRLNKKLMNWRETS